MACVRACVACVRARVFALARASTRARARRRGTLPARGMRKGSVQKTPSRASDCSELARRVRACVDWVSSLWKGYEGIASVDGRTDGQ